MNKVKLLIGAAVLSSTISTAAFAGEWKQDNNGWWYENDNGSYSVNCWQEINGKQYFFNESGYILTNTTAPDGRQVGADGALIQTPLFDFALEDCHVKYVKHEVSSDYEGNLCVLVYYDFTNTSDKAQSAMASGSSIKAYQNGIECGSAYVSSLENANVDNRYKNILPGITLEVAQAFKISDKTAITLTVEDMWDWSSNKNMATAILNLE